MAPRLDLAKAARSSGLKVVVLPGWKKRGRPVSTGRFNPSGVLVHHTASRDDSRRYVEWMAYTGRSDLPAPLCQLALSRTGVVYVCAAGRSNHAGRAKASGPMPSGDGNTLYIGIEALNDGYEGWTKRQYDAYVRLCAALCKHYGWKATHVRAHKETSTTGKIDPGKMDMQDFRTKVGAQLHKKKRAPTLVSRARSLLTQAMVNAKNMPKRRKMIREARDTLPKR